MNGVLSEAGFIDDTNGFFLQEEDRMCVCFVCVPPYLHTVGEVVEVLYEGKVQFM